jgi:molecular chaperone GrpE
MTAERDRRPPVSSSSETDTAAEDGTRSSSAPDPVSEVPSEEALAEDAATAPLPEEGQQESEVPSEASEASDHEAQLEHDLEELAQRAGKADEYLELAQRTKADFENYRKRAAREAAAAQERGIVKLAQELLPVVDDLDRAVSAAQALSSSEDDGAGTLISGIKLVHAGVVAALARVGIEPYSPVGERFDPQHHEAVAQQRVEGTEAGMIVEVYQRGYRLNDGSVLRPARVVVAA